MATLQSSSRTAATLMLHLLIAIIFQFPNFSTSTKLTKLSLNLTSHTPMAKLLGLAMSGPQNSTGLSPEDIGFTLTRTPEYVLMVQASIGTPPIQALLLLDTGSGLIWTQCKPCNYCYPQRYPTYDSMASTTFRKLPCSHPLCSGPRALFQCLNNECVYSLTYTGGSNTKGHASFETFKLSVGKSFRPFPNIIFGCSNENYNFTFAQSGLISGIMGLNMGPDSFLTQLFAPAKRRFSYCFAPYESGPSTAHTILRFGDDVPRGRNLQTTYFRQGTVHYELELLDISVGKRRLNFPPGTFAVKANGNGGFIIDSGTVISRLDQTASGVNAYGTVIEAFKQIYNSLRLQRIMNPGSLGYDLCYRKPPRFNKFVGMTYHLRGADYVVDPKYMVDVNEQLGFFCVALMGSYGHSNLGSWHQQNMRLIYDASMGALRFGAENCARDRL